MSDPHMSHTLHAETDTLWRPQSSVVCSIGDGDILGVLERPALRRSPALLEEALKRQGLAMAVAGHDLKQPLQVIAMVLERIGHKASSPREQLWLDVAMGEVNRISASLDELAVLSRTSDEETPAPLTSRVCVDEVMSDVLATWRHHAAAKGLRLSHVRSSLTVRTNRRLLGVILGNLVSNAIKYTTEGGVLIGCRRQGNAVSIEVLDTGRGFDPEVSTPFAPFWRQDNDMSGLGLGMSIVAQTAALLNHRVTAQSTPGRGSRFSVLVAD